MVSGGDGGWRGVTASLSFLRLLSCLLLNSFDRILGGAELLDFRCTFASGIDQLVPVLDKGFAICQDTDRPSEQTPIGYPILLPGRMLMSRLRSLLRSAMKWGWFAALGLLALAYLVAGLSDPTGESSPHPSSVQSSNVSLAGRGGEPVSPSMRESVTELDAVWRQSLDQQGFTAAGPADWMTVCRRLSLALVGSGMSLEEIRRLESVALPDRVATHLETLLEDGRFHDYWSERWTRYLVGTDDGQFIVYRRRRFRTWLSEQFAENMKYDDLVKRLITSQGLWTDKPEVNFLTATYDSNDNQPDPIRLAARTSRVFLGLRIDCLQCHDDFLGNVSLGDVDDPREGKQTDFHQLAAFYTAAKNNGFRGVYDGKPDYQYMYLDETETTDVQPSVPFGPQWLPTEGPWRTRLAKWITHPENHQAMRSAVSHVWALMYGRSAGEAVDNLPLDAASPPMIDWLAKDFATHGFDLRRLIRLIALSSAFGVDSRADFEVTPSMEDAGAVFPLVRLRPEQVAGSVVQAARVKRTDRESSVLLQLVTFGNVNDFVERYGDMGEDEFTTDSVTITQRLMMMNGKVVRELVNSNPVLNVSAHAAMFAKNDAEMVKTVYLAMLNRSPTDVEAEHFANRFSESKSKQKACEDLAWVLANSSEMAWNH